MGSLLFTSEKMGWAPIRFNVIYREMIQRKSFAKKKNLSILQDYTEIIHIYREITLQGFLLRKINKIATLN